MKKFALLITLAMLMTQVQTIAAVTKQPAKKTTTTNSSTAVRTNNNKAYPTSGDDFLLKYNVDDLEAAPWLNGGKRIYNNDKK